MTLRQLYPAASGPVTGDELRELYTPPGGPWLRANMVQSINGSVVGPDGTSNALSSKEDRELLRLIRDLSDVVLVGARSVISEGLHLSNAARTAILVGHTTIQQLAIPAEKASGVLLLVPKSKYDDARTRWEGVVAAVISVPESANGNPEPRGVLETLRQRDLSTITCEGGPRLVGSLLAANCVDDLCLTMSPQIVAPVTPVLLGGPTASRELSLAHMLIGETSALYARWRCT